MTKLDPELGLVLMRGLMSRAKQGFTNLDPCDVGSQRLKKILVNAIT